MMHPTEVVGASNQIHACLKGMQTACSMSGRSREAGESFSECSIEALDECGSEDRSSSRALEQLLCLGEQTMSHPPRDLDTPFFLCSLDDRANVEL
jgi:hypothetical protein